MKCFFSRICIAISYNALHLQGQAQKSCQTLSKAFEKSNNIIPMVTCSALVAVRWGTDLLLPLLGLGPLLIVLLLQLVLPLLLFIRRRVVVIRWWQTYTDIESTVKYRAATMQYENSLADRVLERSRSTFISNVLN